jgi:hypothetical protein
MQLAELKKTQVFNRGPPTTTVTRESFIDPRQMEDRAGQPAGSISIPEMIEKNRAGLSYDMIFMHGHKEDFTPGVRLVWVGS